MNELFESEKNSLRNAEEVADIADNPVVKTAASLINLFPGAGTAITSMISGGLEMFQKEKREKIQRIIFEDGTITLDDIKDVRFIMEYVKLLDVVDRLSTNTKVEYLGKLFKNSVLSDEEDKYDLFEERMNKFNELSNREIEVLYYLYCVQKDLAGVSFPKDTPDDKRLRIWSMFLEIAEEHGYKKWESESIIAGTTRTGFCKLQYLNTKEKNKIIYSVTGEYFNFIEMIGMNK